MSDHGGGGIVDGINNRTKKIFGFGILKLSGHGGFIDWIGEWGVSRCLVLIIMFCALMGVLSLEIRDLPLFTAEWLIGLAPIWLPFGLIAGSWVLWIKYVQSHFLAGRKPVLLEVKMPREITKSPRAMEVALTNLWLSSGETTFIDRAWKGQVRPYFSFEMASFGGDIHFYIWCWGAQRAFVEQTIYGQYPEVELFEVEDYASKFELDPHKHWCFATDWSKAPLGSLGTYGSGKFDRIDCYPLKTYVDYELDKDPKEEHRVDPIASILELLGSINADEQIWISLVIRRCGKYGILLTHGRDDEWRDATKQEVEKIRTRAAIVPREILKAEMKKMGLEEDARPPQVRPSWMQAQVMQSMERNLSKLPFELNGHAVYITTGSPRSPFFTTMRWLWKPYGNQNFSSYMRPTRWHAPFDYPWQDFHDYRRNNVTARRFFDMYRRRGGFHTPWILPSNVLTVEELATLWHPPSATVQAPGLERIPATKSAPPANLPM